MAKRLGRSKREQFTRVKQPKKKFTYVSGFWTKGGYRDFISINANNAVVVKNRLKTYFNRLFYNKIFQKEF